MRTSRATAPRMTPVVVFAAGVAALIAWTLRDRAAFLPNGNATRSALASGTGHHPGGGGSSAPPPVAGDALANYAGLAALALHALIVVVAVVAYAVRRVPRRSAVDAHGVLPRLVFAGTVAVMSALVTAWMAAILLGTAISPGATLAAALTVLQYSFVLVVVFTVVLGLP